MSYRIEFRLSMPGRSSWDGKWSGEGRNYSLVRELADEDLAKLFGLAPENFDLSKCRSSWTHRWSDGWLAEVSARVVPIKEELPKSDGFNGYDWMVDNILRNGSPYGEVTS
jgi:hypothetical protein